MASDSDSDWDADFDEPTKLTLPISSPKPTVVLSGLAPNPDNVEDWGDDFDDPEPTVKPTTLSTLQAFLLRRFHNPQFQNLFLVERGKYQNECFNCPLGRKFPFSRSEALQHGETRSCAAFPNALS